MIDNETPVSHVDLYHKLGRMEALLETMMSSLGNFQVAIKDIHTRIDALETRQNALENSTSSATGAASALTALVKDFALPFLAVAVTWIIAKEQVVEKARPKTISTPAPIHVPYSGTIEPVKSP
jgi:hypothetical protein